MTLTPRPLRRPDAGRRFTAEPRMQARPSGGFTPLLYAARRGCAECARHLLDGGASINLTDPDRVTSLLLSAPGGSLIAQVTRDLEMFIAAEAAAGPERVSPADMSPSSPLPYTFTISWPAGTPPSRLIACSNTRLAAAWWSPL